MKWLAACAHVHSTRVHPSVPHCLRVAAESRIPGRLGPARNQARRHSLPHGTPRYRSYYWYAYFDSFISSCAHNSGCGFPDSLAHLVIPRHPPLRPQAPILHHFRFLLPLFSKDEEGMTPLHYYGSAIQLARHASREPTEQEYIVGMLAAKEIDKV